VKQVWQGIRGRQQHALLAGETSTESNNREQQSVPTRKQPHMQIHGQILFRKSNKIKHLNLT
jgi:hypothetical protein